VPCITQLYNNLRRKVSEKGHFLPPVIASYRGFFNTITLEMSVSNVKKVCLFHKTVKLFSRVHFSGNTISIFSGI
jgi:hypothetical protein